MIACSLLMGLYGHRYLQNGVYDGCHGPGRSVIALLLNCLSTISCVEYGNSNSHF